MNMSRLVIAGHIIIKQIDPDFVAQLMNYFKGSHRDYVPIIQLLDDYDEIEIIGEEYGFCIYRDDTMKFLISGFSNLDFEKTKGLLRLIAIFLRKKNIQYKISLSDDFGDYDID